MTRRRLFVGPATFLLVLLLGSRPRVAAEPVSIIEIDGAIGPITVRLLNAAIERARADHAQALVVELNTPGGLERSMRSMVQSILSSEIPVIVYVAPTGARAASAGVFITMAGHVAAMAPATNIGAAHPVAVGGQMDKEMVKKVESDAAAFARTIATERGRNVEWAEKAVRSSVSATEREAVKLKVIDLIADNVPDLLAKVDGRTVKTSKGMVTLHTRDATVKRIEVRFRDRFLALISDPNVAYILMMVGMLGIFFELSTPGAVLPGVVGGISLILAFFAFQSLPVNWAGLLLILFGLVLLVVEIKVTSHGILTVGGVVAMLLGSLMLYDVPESGLRISWFVLASHRGRDGGSGDVRGRRGTTRAAPPTDHGRGGHGGPYGCGEDGARSGGPSAGRRRAVGSGDAGRPGAARRARRDRERGRAHAHGRPGPRGEPKPRRRTMGGFELIWGLVPVIVIALFVFASSVRILREYERGVIFRFGRRSNAIFNPGGDGSGPGLILLIPFIDKMVKVSLRTITMDVPPQDVITRDNVSVKVNAVIFFRVLDANKAVISVEDYLYATSQMAQTTLRSVLGQQELDDLLASREKINEELTRIIDQHTNPWGVKVAAVEVKNVDLPQDMQRAMSKQAEAERERRAKVINAEGEFQAAAKLAEAADVLTRFPIAVQLRYLQTMREIASERNTTTFFPLPIDLFTPLLRAMGEAQAPKA